MNNSQEIILRIKSGFGTNRITMNKNSTFADLKAEVSDFLYFYKKTIIFQFFELSRQLDFKKIEKSTKFFITC